MQTKKLWNLFSQLLKIQSSYLLRGRHAHTRICPHEHTCTHTHTHAHTYTHMHAHTQQTHMCVHTHTHTKHTHTHTKFTEKSNLKKPGVFLPTYIHIYVVTNVASWLAT